MILPEIISKEPLGPATRQGDDQWADIIRWVYNATVTAEEKGITSANVQSMMTANDPEILRLLGVEGSQGEELGLNKDWAYQVIKQIGNYGEIYNRNLGPGGINLPREGGRNALWADATCTDCPRGGQIYAAPLR